MSQERLKSIVVIIPARIMLKHLYSPKNPVYFIRYFFMSKSRKNLALIALAELACINENMQINHLGYEIAELIIAEDRRYLIPNILSLLALAISVVNICLR